MRPQPGSDDQDNSASRENHGKGDEQEDRGRFVNTAVFADRIAGEFPDLVSVYEKQMPQINIIPAQRRSPKGLRRISAIVTPFL